MTESQHPAIIPGNRRRCVLLFILAAGTGLAALQWFFPWLEGFAARAHCTEIAGYNGSIVLFAAVFVSSTGSVFLFTLWLAYFSGKVLRSVQAPPPGAWVCRDTVPVTAGGRVSGRSRSRHAAHGRRAAVPGHPELPGSPGRPDRAAPGNAACSLCRNRGGGRLQSASTATPQTAPVRRAAIMKRLPASIVLAMTIVFSAPAWSWDRAMAESYARLFAPVQGVDAGKALQLMSPEDFVAKVKAGTPLTVLDIRTPAETAIYGMTLPDTLVIPVNELFTGANLDRIPTDRTVVVICVSGTRAASAGIALRHVGFGNAYVLKGGFKSLVNYLGAKEANTPPPAAAGAAQQPPAPAADAPDAACTTCQ